MVKPGARHVQGRIRIIAGAWRGRRIEIPEGTVRGRIRRAKQLLEEQLSLLAENDVDLESTMSNLDSWAKSLRAKILPPEG